MTATAKIVCANCDGRGAVIEGKNAIDCPVCLATGNPPLLHAALLEYTHAIGDAGETYLKKVSPAGYHLSGMFFWHELWEAMVSAANSSQQQTTGEIDTQRRKKPHSSLHKCDECGWMKYDPE